MESNNRRNIWIIIVILLVAACCCLLLAAVAAVSYFGDWSFDWDQVSGSETERLEETFEVGSAPDLEIDSFAGSITVEVGEADTIQVVATKRARSKSSLEKIEVEMSERGGGLVIQARKPASLLNAWVQFEIVVPEDTQLDAHTGSGSVDVRGLRGNVRVDTGSGEVDAADLGGDVDVHTGSGSISVRGATGDVRVDTGSGGINIVDAAGDIDAHTGSGSIEVRGAIGQVELDTGSGSIQYEGRPEGDCRFDTGSGGITLLLPDELNVEVELDTGSGSIDLDYDVDGRVTRREVEGVIGDGSQGSIYAHTGTGGIDLRRQ
jgi:DUF4097 and DUF4098 domain-containing protein YvlB